MKYRGYAKRADANESEIARALVGIGCEVEKLTGSAGMPDLMVCLGSRLYLLEVKTDKGKPNADQMLFHHRFPVKVVRSIDDALDAVTKQ